jgi:tRNA(fMet)-specific endonuclease VapC
VEKALILETTFLIDLERELARKLEGPAQKYLQAHASHRLYITFTTAGELASGVSLGDRTKWEQFVALFQILPFNKDVCWEYGQAYRFLQKNGLLIGANDLWIAATARAYGVALVTRNARHYRRVPGVEVADYPASVSRSRVKQRKQGSSRAGSV